MDEMDTTSLTNDEFDIAFDAAINGAVEDPPEEEAPIEETPAEETVAEEKPAEEKPVDEAEEKPTEEKPTEEKPTEEKPTEEKPTEEEPAEEKPVEKKQPSAEDLAADVARKLAADAKAKQEAEDKRIADAAAAKAAKEAENPTKEESELLDTVATEFPDVYKILPVIERVITAKLNNILEGRLGELTTALNKTLAPVISTTRTVANNAHEAAILGAHADAFTLLPEIEQWIATQPALVRPAYDRVLDAGSAEEIIELVSMFKDDTGRVEKDTGASDADTAAAEAAQKKRDKEAEAKLQAQERVKGRSAHTRTAVDPDDFDGAFDKYAGESA